ncbi:MAG: tetratricopeptide repeat protein [Alphaproteobacteria bacterium]|nr:tetratricopeptide repeat protein [Alphaproteobacteria bacterium]
MNDPATHPGRPVNGPSDSILRLSDCTVDLARHRLVREGDTTSLTTREAELLAYLAAREGTDVERDALLTDVWGYKSSNPTRAVDFTIRRLRTKVEPDPANPVHIISVRGVGYRFVGNTMPEILDVDAPPDDEPAAPPAPPAEPPDSTLPPPRTRFIGRVRELERLETLLTEGRLVVLLGMGGSGKTRLAQEWAHTHRDRWPGGVWFCDLTPARDLGDVLDAIAAGVRAGLDARATVEQSLDKLATAIDERGECLVLIDNAEHVPLGPVVEQWLDRTHDARFVVTTRERLGIRGEAVLNVQPMEDDDAIALFVDRACAVRGPEAVTHADDSAIREIVRGLDGLPLAIEIAASRVGSMAPAQLAKRLQSRFKLITAQPGTRPDRHASLRAALDWSWDLLDDWERQALCVASIFRGGFTLEAAEEVLLPEDPDAPWTLDLLQSLTDKSLVLTESPSGGDVRYRLLESVRAYAGEKLEALGDADALRARHAEYYIREGENLAAAVEGPAGAEMLERLAAERGNLMAAWMKAPDPVQRVRAALAVRVVLLMRGPLDGFAELLDQMVALAAQAPPAVRARTYIARARFLEGHRPEDAEADLLRALDDAGELPELRAMALYTLASIRTTQTRYDEAESSFREAMELHARTGERAAMGRDAIGLAYILAKKGAVDAAERMYQRALAVFRRTGDRWGIGLALANLFGLVDSAGKFDIADQYAREAIGILTDVGDRKNCARVLCQHGIRLHWRGRNDEAERAFRDALALQQQIGDRRWEGVVLTDLADLLLADDRLAEAEALLTEAMGIARESDDPLQEAQVLRAMGIVRVLEETDWEADAHLEDSLAILRQHDALHLLPATLHGLALLRLEQRRLDEVMGYLSEAEREASRQGMPRLRALLAGIRVATYVASGDHDAAQAELDHTEELLGPYAPSLPGLGAVARAWVAHGAGYADAAVEHLSKATATEPTVALLARTLQRELEPEDDSWLL